MAVNRNTFITIPRDVTNPEELRRFLSRLIEELDVAFGNRADRPFASSITVNSVEDGVVSLQEALDQLAALVDENNTTIISNTELIETNNSNIAELQNNLEQTAISDLSLPSLSFSATYTPSELDTLAAQVQTTEAKLNAILVALRDSKIISI